MTTTTQFIMKILYLILLFLSSCTNPKSQKSTIQAEPNPLPQKAEEALQFCQKNKYNTDFCLLINLKKHSGKKRFYVWDFNKNVVIDSGMVSHDCGNLPWGKDYSKTNPTFSNITDSHLASLGKYKIGNRAYSQWGINIKYELHGLDSTNNNAYKRIIVLHSWNDVSEEETYPKGTPEGYGCPATSNDFLRRIDTMLQKSKKPVLLWSFY
jgi:hypothetical protein